MYVADTGSVVEKLPDAMVDETVATEFCALYDQGAGEGTEEYMTEAR